MVSRGAVVEPQAPDGLPSLTERHPEVNRWLGDLQCLVNKPAPISMLISFLLFAKSEKRMSHKRQYLH